MLARDASWGRACARPQPIRSFPWHLGQFGRGPGLFAYGALIVSGASAVPLPPELLATTRTL